MKPRFLRSLTLLAGAASLLSSCGNLHQDSNKIRIGLECAYIPFNWVSDSGANDFTLPIANHAGSYADGYDIQIAKRLSKELGKEVEIVQTNWESLITDLQMNSIDAIIAGMTDTETRRLQISFTDEYYRSELVLVTSASVASRYEGTVSVEEFGALVSGQNIVSQIATVTDDVIDTFASEYGARHVTPVATSICGKLNGLGIVHFDQEVLGEAKSELGVSIGVRKNDEQLRNDINGVLAKISTKEREELMAASVSRSGGAQ